MAFVRRIVDRVLQRKKKQRKNDASIYPMF